MLAAGRLWQTAKNNTSIFTRLLGISLMSGNVSDFGEKMNQQTNIDSAVTRCNTQKNKN